MSILDYNTPLGVNVNSPINRVERTPEAVAVNVVYGKAGADSFLLSAPASPTSSDSAGAVVTTFPAPPEQTYSPPSTSLPDSLKDASSAGEAYLEQWTCTNEVARKEGTRIVGYGVLRNLLQPVHPYFHDKWALINYWTRYYDEKNGYDLIYPRVKTLHRLNPYRKHQLNSQCSVRSAKLLFNFIEKEKLSGVRVVDMELTSPKLISYYLAGKGKSGISSSWSMNSRFWQLMKEYSFVGDGFTRRANLHMRSSENPLEPHVHTHNLSLNYEQAGIVGKGTRMGWACPKCNDDNWIKDNPASFYCATCHPSEPKPVLIKQSWKRRASGGLVPWDDKDLLMIKAIWLSVNIAFAKQHCIDGCWDNQSKLFEFYRKYKIRGLYRLLSFLSRFERGLIDVRIDWVPLNTDTGKAKFIHKLKYNGRHPVEDLAYYSNKNPDCEIPEDIVRHDNKARVFGFWNRLNDICPLSKDYERAKLSPYTGEALVPVNGCMGYLSRFTTPEVLDFHDGKLIGVDFVKGEAYERQLSEDEKYWLLSTQYVT